jgi:hypothetical protein
MAHNCGPPRQSRAHAQGLASAAVQTMVIMARLQRIGTMQRDKSSAFSTRKDDYLVWMTGARATVSICSHKRETGFGVGAGRRPLIRGAPYARSSWCGDLQVSRRGSICRIEST